MADKGEIIDAIEGLAVHCRPPLMSVEDKARWMRDWAEDLSEFPIEAILGATKKWRMSGNTKFPTAGQFMPMLRQLIPSDREGSSGPWYEAGPEEYEAMTLREKIREQKIRASVAGGKAKQMFRNTSVPGRFSGVHIRAEDMPESHHRWRQIEVDHLREAKRLREIMINSRLPE